jgi:Ca2+-binding RTX toxin-like protein
VIWPDPGQTPNIQFLAGAGNDTLHNRNDPEYFDGDLGIDLVVVPGTGGGDDLFNGGQDGDNLLGGAGNDTINGGTGGDSITGGANDDTLHGGPGTDYIYGNDGDDLIYGDADGDNLIGGVGDDRLYTGTSSAAFIIPGGPLTAFFEYAWGDENDDMVDATSATGAAYLEGFTGRDVILGSSFNDEIYGGGDSDLVEGRAGDDKIDGNDHADILWSNVPGPVDQPWNANGQGTAGWFDMSDSGPDDGYCDVEDGHPDEPAAPQRGAQSDLLKFSGKYLSPWGGFGRPIFLKASDKPTIARASWALPFTARTTPTRKRTG